MAKDGKALILIRKEEVAEGGHHGGAWKVAYADFVTAMMAFFLLMWLLNATTQEQRRGIADYFSPHNEMARTTSGYGAPFGGRTPNSDGSLASDRGAVQVLNAPPMPNLMTEDDESGDVHAETALSRQVPGAAGNGTGGAATGTMTGSPSGTTAGIAAGARAEKPPALPATQPQAGVNPHPPTQTRPTTTPPTDQDLQTELDRREKASFERAAQQIRDAITLDPQLADLARQLMIDVTPEGLRIQLVDAERQPMFATGSAALNDRARAVLAKVTPVLLRLPQSISVSGHTDATPYRGADRSNWDLSADRANVTRRLLVEAGLPEGRIRSVSGMADRDPLVSDDALAAANRRIAIVVLRDKPATAR